MSRSSGPHDCPECRAEIPWQQRYLRSWAWSTWRCNHCDAPLRADLVQRLRESIVYLVCGTLFLVVVPSLIDVPSYGPSWFILLSVAAVLIYVLPGPRSVVVAADDV